MGKGSSRRNEDFKKIQANWDEIDWSNKSDYCFNCGAKINKERLDLYIKHDDGTLECKSCNFN